jgi:hypothetical protein
VVRVGVRLGLFMGFSALIINAGVSPLQAPLSVDDSVLQLGATALGVLWWLYAAGVLTEIIGLVLVRRIGHSGRLLQDVIGADPQRRVSGVVAKTSRLTQARSHTSPTSRTFPRHAKVSEV